MKKTILVFIALLLTALDQFAANATMPFTGRIKAILVFGSETQTLIYTAGTNCLRIERGETNRPYPCDLIDRTSGTVTLLLPHNRTYLQLSNNPAPSVPAFPGMPALPPGIGPQSANMGPGNFPAAPVMRVPPGLSNMPSMPQPGSAMSSMPQASPGMPMMPPPGRGTPQPGMRNGPAMPQPGIGMPMMPIMSSPLELAAQDGTTNLLGFVCRRYELKQSGATMEIWAAQTNLPFAKYLPNQPPRFDSQTIEDDWAGLVAAKKLFPLLAVLKYENGTERLRYEVKSIVPQKWDEKSAELFGPPAEYRQIKPLPF